MPLESINPILKIYYKVYVYEKCLSFKSEGIGFFVINTNSMLS
jgi:hypothetical protein